MFWKIAALGKITRLGITPPAPRPDRHGLAMVVILKNEARSIGEWAWFHHAAGARHFYVYDYGCTDETLPILRRTLPPEALTVFPWNMVVRDVRLRRTFHNQVLAYVHAISNFGAAYRWMVFIDGDEFLIPKQTRTIPEALAHLEGARNLSLPWHMFGHSGHETPMEGLLEPYTMRARDPMSPARGVRNFKTVADPCHVTSIRIHSMETDGDDRTWNDRGVCVRFKDRTKRSFYSSDYLQLNHYFARSKQELAQKVARGPCSPTAPADYTRKTLRAVANIEADLVEDLVARNYVRSLRQTP